MFRRIIVRGHSYVQNQIEGLWLVLCRRLRSRLSLIFQAIE
jgi:hypothetical protein